MPGTLPRIRLGLALERLREQRGLTVGTVAARLGYSSGKVRNLEKYRINKVDPAVVAAMLDIYEVDAAKRQYLIDLAWAARNQDEWWHGYDIGDPYTHFIGMEQAASHLRTWHELAIPGLLQTAEYAAELISRGPDDLAADQVRELVKVRGERQKLIDRPDPPRYEVLLDEAALHRIVGGPDVMRAQLEHVLAIARRRFITIQVVPFTAGAHPAMTGPFTLLRFPVDDLQVVYLERVTGASMDEHPDPVRRHEAVWRGVKDLALKSAASLDLIAARAAAI